MFPEFKKNLLQIIYAFLASKHSQSHYFFNTKTSGLIVSLHNNGGEIIVYDGEIDVQPYLTFINPEFIAALTNIIETPYYCEIIFCLPELREVLSGQFLENLNQLISDRDFRLLENDLSSLEDNIDIISKNIEIADNFQDFETHEAVIEILNSLYESIALIPVLAWVNVINYHLRVSNNPSLAILENKYYDLQELAEPLKNKAKSFMRKITNYLQSAIAKNRLSGLNKFITNVQLLIVKYSLDEFDILENFSKLIREKRFKNSNDNNQNYNFMRASLTECSTSVPPSPQLYSQDTPLTDEFTSFDLT